MKFLNFLICFSFFLCGFELWAQNIRKCSSTQKYCYVFNKRLVTGDKVSIVNEKNQLVAIGEIAEMKESVRKIVILKKYANITTKCKVSIVSDSDLQNPSERFDMIQPVPSNYIYGAFNLGALRVGQGSTAFGIDGGYEWSLKNGVSYGAKGVFYYASGEATIYGVDDEQPKTDISTFGLLMEGVGAYRTSEARTLSFKVEVEAGLGFISFDKGQVSEYDEVEGLGDYDKGIALTFGSGGYVIYNSKTSLKPYLGASLSWLKSKLYIRLGAGFSVYTY